MLVLVWGHPGTGKSTVAERVAERLDGRLLRTDVVRKELSLEPEYTSTETRAVYDELFDRAGNATPDGAHVVLDGTFRQKALRERAAAVAADAGVAFRLVRVTCEEEAVRERIRARRRPERRRFRHPPEAESRVRTAGARRPSRRR